MKTIILATVEKETEKAFNIPKITQSLKKDYEEGKISKEEVAEELYEANLTPYVCIKRAIQKIYEN